MKCSVIAEIGWNHMGNISLAKEMISAASESGADFAKFQTWSVEKLKRGEWDNDGRIEIYSKAELTRDDHLDLAEYCYNNNIGFLTSVFNIDDVEWLKDVSNMAIKIPSHEVYNKNLIRSVDGLFDNIFVSTGAAEWSGVEIIPLLIKKSKLTLFHCVSSYPCSSNNVNLPSIDKLREINSSVGYSGHYFGVDDAILSLSYGVEYIEKHFTIDRSLPGRDNQFAILPNELKLITGICKNNADMNIDHGANLQKCEHDTMENYRGRWMA